MHKPITFVCRDKSFAQLARELLVQPPGKKHDPVRAPALAARIGELDKGDNLNWWRNRPDWVLHLVEHLKINREDLGLAQQVGPHVFEFVDAPDIPPLDLRRQKHWVIGAPKFSPREGTYSVLDSSMRRAMGYWISELSSEPARGRIQWLHVSDKLEFELLTRRIQARGNRNVMMCEALREVFTNEEKLSDLLTPQPLIISMEKKADLSDLEKLLSERNDAPLLVISRSPLPPLPREKDAADKDPGNEYGQKIECWEWTFSVNWRDLLLAWIGSQLRGKDHSAYLDEEVNKWFAALDPNYQLIRSPSDVLKLAQIVSKDSEKKLPDLSNSTLGKAFVQEFFKITDRGCKALMASTRSHWNDLSIALDGDLPPVIWEKVAKEKRTGTDRLFTNDENGFKFQTQMVFRLLLRDLLIEEIKNGEIHRLAKACFDSERRQIVDAALDASSVDVLARVARLLEHEEAPMVVIGVAEALFMAIGRRISEYLSNNEEHIGKAIPEDVQRLIAHRVVTGLDFNKDFGSPWSRPLDSIAAQSEWVSACWAWSMLPLPSGVSTHDTWLFPGWSKNLPAKFPDWLFPRAVYTNADDELGTDWCYAEKGNFIAIVEYWLSQRNGDKYAQTISDQTPIFLKIAQLRRAGKEALPANAAWWDGICGTQWAEDAVLRNSESLDGSARIRLANIWWKSLVAYMKQKEATNPKAGDYRWGKVKQKPPRVFQWATEQLESDSHKTLAIISHEERLWLAENPQLLNLTFKMELLNSLAGHLPSMGWSIFFNLSPPGFLAGFGVDSVSGIAPFIEDAFLGQEAAHIMWNGQSEIPAKLLRSPTVSRNSKILLIRTCPTRNLADAIAWLKGNQGILDAAELKSWVRQHLPNAGENAAELLSLIPSPYSGGSDSNVLH